MSEMEVEVRTTTTESETEIATVSNLRSTEIGAIREQLEMTLNEIGRQTEAVAQTFGWAVEEFPYANPSDVWYHGMYRQFVGESSNQSALQRWRAVSGDAFEKFVLAYYGARLPPYISMVSVSDPLVKEQFERLGGTEFSADDIADIALVGEYDGEYQVFGGVNCLTSFKGRLEEYAEGATILQNNGLFAPVITLDVYTNDNSIENRGELSNDQVRRKPARLVEEQQAFSNLYSFNSRSDESDPVTPRHAVKRIDAPSFFDMFQYDVVSFWDQHTKTLRTTDTLTLTE